eukprot:1339537-Lingulodinium_polyedra.AAC.1
MARAAGCRPTTVTGAGGPWCCGARGSRSWCGRRTWCCWLAGERRARRPRTRCLRQPRCRPA